MGTKRIQNVCISGVSGHKVNIPTYRKNPQKMLLLAVSKLLSETAPGRLEGTQEANTAIHSIGEEIIKTESIFPQVFIEPKNVFMGPNIADIIFFSTREALKEIVKFITDEELWDVVYIAIYQVVSDSHMLSPILVQKSGSGTITKITDDSVTIESDGETDKCTKDSPPDDPINPPLLFGEIPLDDCLYDVLLK